MDKLRLMGRRGLSGPDRRGKKTGFGSKKTSTGAFRTSSGVHLGGIFGVPRPSVGPIDTQRSRFGAEKQRWG